jgi:hypothetical protein
VPDLVGQPAAGCVAELRKLGLKPNSVPEPVTDPSQAGLVIAQDPAAGELVPANTRVRIEIGDHSLFDAREYDTPTPTEPEFEYFIPPVPEPHELLAPRNEQTQWVPDEEMPELTAAPPSGSAIVEGLGARWDELGDHHPRTAEINGIAAADPDVGRLSRDPDIAAGRSDDIHPRHISRRRFTRRQRNRMFLSAGLLVLLACLTFMTHRGANGPARAHRSTIAPGISMRRVVTVTVTAPATPTTRGHLPPQARAER